MKIGIFGGCFNPPHSMHIGIAEKLINTKYLDKVVFVPTGNNYSKVDLTNIENRIDMLKLTFNNENIIVSDICKNSDYGYTYQILDYFKDNYKGSDIYFICGSDNLIEFETWKRYEYILSNYKLIVIARNNDNLEEILKKYSKYRNNIEILNIIKNPISSSLLRKNIRNRNFDYVSRYLNCEVVEYIINNKLY